jgi:hypothetical protein
VRQNESSRENQFKLLIELTDRHAKIVTPLALSRYLLRLHREGMKPIISTIMAKRLKASAKASPPKRPSKKLSLYPLDLSTALGTALQAGPMPRKPDKKTRPSKS